MRRGWRLLIFVFTLLGAEEVRLPGPSSISSEISRLSAEQSAERQEAKGQLEEWAKRYPRYMLTFYAREYKQRDDLEVSFQLEHLLREMASEILFYQPKAFLGVNFELSLLPDGTDAIRLENVIEGSPADVAGLKAGDYLLEVDGVSVDTYEDASDFAAQIQKQLPLEGLDLRVLRKEKEFYVEVFLTVKEVNASLVHDRIGEEERKIEAWIKALRPPDKASTYEPVGSFRLD